MKRLISVAFVVFMSQTVMAQTIAVQGVLRDPAGRTVTDGSHTVVFKLYDAESGGTELWSESHGSVPTSHGVFSETLGMSTSMSSLTFTEQYWLGIKVDDGTEISQRMKLQSAPASNAVTGSSNIVPSTGNIGFGTLTPSTDLEVSGSGIQSVKITSSDDQAALSLESDGTGENIIYTPSGSDDLRFNSGSTDKMTLTSGGNLGIGTTDPQAAIEINTQTPYIQYTDTDGGSAWLVGNYGGNRFLIQENGDDRLVVREGGNVGIGSSVPTSNLEIQSLDNGSKLKVRTSHTGGAPIFEVEQANSDGLVSVRTGGGTTVTQLSGYTPTPSYLLSDVGIGTATPSEKLDVAGNIKISNGGVLIFQDGTSLASAELGGSAASVANTANTIITADSDEDGTGGIQFKTGVSTDMTVTNSGNVGIGTSTPVYKFDLNSDAAANWIGRFRNTVNGAAVYMSSGDGYGMSVDPGDNANSGTYALQVHDGSGGTAFFVRGDGRVGLGTNSPVAPLHVVGESYFENRLRLMRTVGSNYIDFNRGQNFYLRSIGTDDTSDTIRLAIATNGFVGMGTTVPAFKLDVQANIASWASGFTNDANGAGVYLSHGGGYGMSIDPGDNANSETYALQVYDGSGGTPFFVRGDGRVGLGTSSPVAPLHVVGESYFENRLRLMRTGGPNYVDFYNGEHLVFRSIDTDDTGGQNIMDLFDNSGIPTLRMFQSSSNIWDVEALNAFRRIRYNGSLTFEFHSNGNAWMPGTLITNSDRRLKRNISTVVNGLDKVMNMRGVTYLWKQDQPSGITPDSRLHYGFVAQEMEDVLPEIVVDNPNGYKTISYSEVSSVLVEAIKEQQSQIESQEATIQILMDRLAQVEAALEKK